MAAPIEDRGPGPRPWTAPLMACLAWGALLAFCVTRLEPRDGRLIAALALIPAGLTLLLPALLRRRLSQVEAVGSTFPSARQSRTFVTPPRPRSEGSSLNAAPGAPSDSLTRSGLYDSPPLGGHVSPSGDLSRVFSIVDMVNRLDPRDLRWIESSLAEQQFLGWTFHELQKKSFLEIIHLDDRARAEEALRSALIRGESLGLVVRISTARGKPRVIEVNAGARYGAGTGASHLRCHITDVTDKVRAERALRHRTRELIQVNEQLRTINRELVELKDRYTDLYDNAPAMYFSLDAEGLVLQCNQTLLTTLGRGREEVIGKDFFRFIVASDRTRCLAKLAELMEFGSIEAQSRLEKANGEILDVWISGRLNPGSGAIRPETRCVARDLTATHRLEAELVRSNQSLANANAELSRKNRELDEFVHVISHDLAEPVRTLIGFSDFLVKDHGDKLGPGGVEYLGYLADAAQRMRRMIYGLLNLSRAGKVTGEFGPVTLGELAEAVIFELGALIRGRGAVVEVLGPGVVFWGDGPRLHQLVANLVSNAIKYNRSAVPRVEIGPLGPEGIGPEGATVPDRLQTLYVQDNGIGIDPRFHETIFHPFRRLHSPDEYEGTGVGLSICAKIVQAHGGQLWLESAPGKGSRFLVSLPGASPDTTDPEEPGGETHPSYSGR